MRITSIFHGFVLIAALNVVAQEQPSYSSTAIKHLGAWSRGTHAAYGINNRGQAVGVTNVGTATPPALNPFIWDKVLGTQDLGFEGKAYAVNDKGTIVGVAGLDAFLWSPSAGETIITQGVARAINARGDVVGGFNSNGSGVAFLWSPNGGLQDLGAGLESVAFGVNDNRQIAGWYQTAAHLFHAFFWTPQNGIQDIHAMGSESFATAINARGQVVGYFYLPQGDGTYVIHGFLWSRTAGFRDIGYVAANNQDVEPQAINDKGQIVGRAGTANGEGGAFIWTKEKGFQDLNALAGYQSPILKRATGINHFGQIVTENMRVLTPIMRVNLVSSANPSTLGDTVTLTATVGSISGPPPDGEKVVFKIGAVTLGTAPTKRGIAVLEVSTLRGGTHGISAFYLGDATYSRSKPALLRQTVNP
jgi:probable HAF family extracellular repeat protein